MDTAKRETYAVPTLSQLMDLHGNDWDRENKIFQTMTSRSLDDQKRLEFATLWNLLSAWDVGRRISLVIPAQLAERKKHLQLTLHALQYQTFFSLRPRHSILEIIIVNDGPATPEDVFQVARYKHELAELRVFCLKESLRPARARNVGLYYSRGDIVFFLDCDMLLEPDLIAEHIIRHEYIPNLALLSFRADIEPSDAEKILIEADSRKKSPEANSAANLLLNAEWEKDWKAREHTIVAESVLNERTLHLGEKVSIYEITHGLREWNGQFHGEGTHCDRNLPSVFATSCVSVRREHLMAVGGFRSHYYGWGIEDRDLGSRLLARGVRLVTVRSAGARHIVHPERTKDEKDGDMKANIARYNSLLHEPYHEYPENLTKQIAQLVRDKIIYPALEFTHGTALPRTQKPQSLQSPLDLALETILRQADSFLRRSIRGMSKNGDPVNVAEGELKWRVVLEESPGGVLSVRIGLNTSHRREGSIRLNHGAGWVGFVVEHAISKLRGSIVPDLGIALRPMAVDFTQTDSKSVEIAHAGLSERDLEHTDYYRFIVAAPIVIFLGWPERSHYCMGAIAVHSALNVDIMQRFASEDGPLVSAIAAGASEEGIKAAIASKKPSAECEFLRDLLRDVAQACGDLIVRYWIDSEHKG
jgi:glycosyltransferase involved in cell wall biosynthesis